MITMISKDCRYQSSLRMVVKSERGTPSLESAEEVGLKFRVGKETCRPTGRSLH